MLERDLERGVVDVCHLLGYRVFHARPAWTRKGYRTPVSYDGQGFCDLVIVGNGRVLFRELKVGRNTLTAEQAAWMSWLRENGADAGVWTDADWEQGLIEAELRRRNEREAA